MAVNYSDLVNVNGTIYNKNTQQGYKDPTMLAQALGISANNIDWNQIAKSSSVPTAPITSPINYSGNFQSSANNTNPVGYSGNFQSSTASTNPIGYTGNYQSALTQTSTVSPNWSNYINYNGTIYNKNTQTGFGSPTALASDLGLSSLPNNWQNNIQSVSSLPWQTAPVSNTSESSQINTRQQSSTQSSAQTSTQSPSLVSGQLYRESGSPDVYYIDPSGNTLHVKDSSTFNSEFGTNAWSKINVVSPGLLSSANTGGELSQGYFSSQNLQNGTIKINPTTGQREIYNSATKTWSPTAEFSVNNPSPGTINTAGVTGGPSSLSLTAKNQILEGSLVREQGTPSVYLMENGKLRWIENEKAFTDAGYDWNKVQTVVPGILSQFAQGGSIDDLAAQFKKDTSLYQDFFKESAESSGYTDAKAEYETAKNKVLTETKSISDWLLNQPTQNEEMKSDKEKLADVDLKINDITSKINNLTWTSEHRPGATKEFVQNETKSIADFYKLDLLALQGERAIYQGQYDEAKLNFQDYLDRTLQAKQLNLKALETALTYSMEGLTLAQQNQATQLQWALNIEQARTEKAQADASNKAAIYTAAISKFGNIPGLFDAYKNPNIDSVSLATLIAPYEAKEHQLLLNKQLSTGSEKNIITAASTLGQMYPGLIGMDSSDPNVGALIANAQAVETALFQQSESSRAKSYVQTKAKDISGWFGKPLFNYDKKVEELANEIYSSSENLFASGSNKGYPILSKDQIASEIKNYYGSNPVNTSMQSSPEPSPTISPAADSNSWEEYFNNLNNNTNSFFKL